MYHQIGNLGKSINNDPLIFQKQIDALEFYTAEEARLTALVEDERKIALSRPIGVAFVTLGLCTLDTRYLHMCARRVNQ